MEKAILSIDKLYISQEMNGSYSHRGDYAIDISRLSYLKAPFTGRIKRIYESCNAVWLESLEKVEYADGTMDYMTVMTLHDNDISDLKVGQVIKQGEIYYQPGKKGKVTGSHIHIAVSKGKFKGKGWYKNPYGYWCIYHQYDITKALYLDKDVKVVKSSYHWNRIDKNESYYPKSNYIGVSIVNALNKLQIDSSFSNRKKIAISNGIENYRGTSSQNLYLLGLLKQGKLKK